MKYAIDQATQLNSKVVFGGLSINNSDLLSLKVNISLKIFSTQTETRMNVIPVMWRFMSLLYNTRWYREYVDQQKVLSVNGGESYAESVDQYIIH